MKLQILPFLISLLLAIGVYSTSQPSFSISIYGQTTTTSTNTTMTPTEGEDVEGKEEKKVELLSHKIRNGSSEYSSDRLIGQVQNMLDKDVTTVLMIYKQLKIFY
jgi:hypothetical protein